MPTTAPPPGFVDLATAQSAGRNSTVAVIGVVVDYMPPKKTYSGDFQATMKLQDHSWRYSSEGLKVKFFKKRFEDLPPIKGIGDVVLFRNIKVSEYAGEILLVSTHFTAQLVFSGAIVPSPAFKLDYVSGNGKLPCQGTDGLRNILGPVEQDYIITLKNELNVQVKAIDTAAPAPVVPGAARSTQPGVIGRPTVYGAFSQKFRLVKDLKDYVFSDVCVEVVKKFTTMNGACELYVTDYTPNKQMFYYAPPEEKNDLVRDGDQFGYNGPPKRNWPGPYGFLVFKVNLSEPHASFANHQVSEGEMIALENIKVKLMPNNNRLEGDMWPDQNNSSKVQVRKISSQRKEIQDLLLRKSEYWEERRARLGKIEGGNDEAPKKKSKGQRKRDRLLRQQQEAEEAQKKADQEDATAVSKIQANKHIRCNYKDQPLTTITNIIDAGNTRHTNTLPDGTSYTLPFVNARYHIKARVVDFYPPRLQDFAIQLLPNEADDDKSEYSVDMTWQESTPHWEWSFALQVEEVASKPKSTTTDSAETAVPRMWLNVSHMEAQHLFGNAVEDPRDLREDKDLLNQLREKLYILWGDLEERKREEDEVERKAKRAKLDDENKSDEQPSNLPFNCCLQEYGALREGGNAEEIADWERQFMMFGVTIL